MKENDIERLISENLNYVKALANQFKGKGVDYDDLVSEGYLAMTKAAYKYDAAKGNGFVAYAAPLIREAMRQAIDQQGCLYRVPRDVKPLQQGATRLKSVDAPLSAGNQHTLLDILESDGQDQLDNTYTRQVVEDLKACVGQLEGRERLVVEKYFGIGGGVRLTMAQIAEDMGLKRERVRQIRNTAVRQLYKHAKSKALKTFLKQ